MKGAKTLSLLFQDMQVSYNNESNIRVKILKEERMRKGFEGKCRECSLGNERCKKTFVIVVLSNKYAR